MVQSVNLDIHLMSCLSIKFSRAFLVGSIALYVPPRKSSRSLSGVNGTKIFQGSSAEPWVLKPLQTTKVLTFDLPTHWEFCFAVVSYCFTASCSSFSCSSLDCADETGRTETLLRASVVPTKYTLDKFLSKRTCFIPFFHNPDSKLLTSTNLIHFGTVSQSTGAMTRHIKLINLQQYDIAITGAESDLYDPALTLNLSMSSVPAKSLVPWAVATLTVSPLNITHSRILNGFVTLLTDVRGVIVRIPFSAKLIHGSLSIQEHRVVIHRISPPQLRFDYVFSNYADVPISVTKPKLPSHRYDGLIELEIPDARLLDGIFDLGAVLLDQQGSSVIALHNRNPIVIEIEAFGVSTTSNATEAWRLVNERTASGADCVTRCLLYSSDETCVSCPVSVTGFFLLCRLMCAPLK
ncbi:hypothetical protein FBUS_02785 [Fasciolopsis buskii]|uniref:Uncharacterized protein n=1 Tax=Fasciolopsis buskii TaxID=27845 RepID=A0A8E0RS24_9TREM|nr:hypothetical protein FBUS_02785 [Fasciolopsis buski]